MIFEQPKYLILDANLELNPITDNIYLEKLWKSTLIKDRVVEEVLETFLVLFIKELTRNESLKLLYRSPNGLYASEDICAVDLLGRINIFEIKKSKITTENFNQLEQYLIRNVLKNPDQFVERRRRSGEDFTSDQLAVYLAGMFANKRTSTEGIDLIKKEWKKNQPEYIKAAFGNFSISKNSYKNKIGTKKNEVLLRTMVKRFRLNCDYEKLESLSSKLYPKLDFLLIEPNYVYKSVDPVIGWLVGPEIKNDVIPKILYLRKTGIDTRVLLVDMRFVKSKNLWIIKLTNEDYKKRDLLEHKLLNDKIDFQNMKSIPNLKFYFYVQKSASKTKESGGNALTQPKAKLSGAGISEQIIEV